MSDVPRNRSRRVYRALLYLLPRTARTRFGSDMEQLFLDRLREARGSSRRVIGLWLAAAWDVVRSGGEDRWSGLAGVTRDWVEGGMSMNGWIQDVRFGIRALLRRPGFSVTAVLTLALGIGANVAIFSVVNGVLLKPLPFPDSERLVTIWSRDVDGGVRSSAIDHPDLAVWNAVVGFSAVGYSPTRPTLTGFGEPEVVFGTRVTGGLITLLGFAPSMGRDLTSADDVADGSPVIVVSHAFWTDRLGRDPDAVGRTIGLNGRSWEIVGVGPLGLDYPAGTQFWAARLHNEEGCSHGCRVMEGLGRIAPDASARAVQSQLAAVSAQLSEAYPKPHQDVVFLERMIDTEVAGVRSGLWILLAAVGMVLLIACANVANLLLVRANQRVGEVALRSTLGATRMRIARQMVTESLVLASAAGALGVLLAFWGTRLLVSLAPDSLPRLDGAKLDGTVLLFAGGVVLLVTVLFGAVPALQASRGALASTIGPSRRSTTGRGAGFSRSTLVAGEIALSLSLLLGAGLLLRTLSEIRAVDLGFATTGVERFRINTPESRYDALGTVRFQEELEERLAGIPGVRAVGLGFGIPLAPGSLNGSAELLDRPEREAADMPNLLVRPATAGFLDASGTALLQGRWFAREDRRDTPGVAVINDATRRQYFADVDPIGQRLDLHISWGFDGDPIRTVVGVIGDVRARSATAEPQPAVYVPNAQFAANSVYVTLALAGGRSSVLPEVRQIIGEMDPALAISDLHRIEDVVSEDQAGTMFYLTLISAFSALALILAAGGLYGVIAFTVSQRTREIGIRIALGARADDVAVMILRQGARPAVAGILMGLALSTLWARLIGSLLYGVAPTDPLVVASATAILVAVVFVATLMPARRASRVPPSAALRAE